MRDFTVYMSAATYIFCNRSSNGSYLTGYFRYFDVFRIRIQILLYFREQWQLIFQFRNNTLVYIDFQAENTENRGRMSEAYGSLWVVPAFCYYIFVISRYYYKILMK